MKRSKKRAIKLLDYIYKKKKKLDEHIYLHDSEMKTLIKLKYYSPTGFQLKGCLIKNSDFLTAKLEKIPIKNIVTSQTTICKKVLSKKIRGLIIFHDPQDPWVIYHKGIYYLEDGNHRVNKNILLGIDSIEARVVYADE